MKTYEETIHDILEIPKFTTKNSLEHTREFLQRLGDPQEQFRIIHVAGSNGKGSVCACIANVLRKSGRKTGLFTSPHLIHLEERFNVDGAPCDRDIFLQAVEIVQQTVDEMVRENLPHPTFFEYIFAVGMVIFAREQVEYAVVETGLGGRLDATNVVEHPILTVITSVSLEHTEILGDTISLIAAEKAGILKPGVPVVYDATEDEASVVIEKRAEELHCPKFPVRPEKIKILLNTGKKIDFSYESDYDVTEVTIPFGAPYQAQNGAVALQSVLCLRDYLCPKDQSCFRVQEENYKAAIQDGFASVVWHGRMQEVRQEIYFDGAHNVAGISSFLTAAAQITQKPAVLLFSMVKEKDYKKAIRMLAEQGNWEHVIVTRIDNARGLTASVLREAFETEAERLHKNFKITEIEHIEEAFMQAAAVKKPGQMLFCAGSLYLIGELERIAGGIEND